MLKIVYQAPTLTPGPFVLPTLLPAHRGDLGGAGSFLRGDADGFSSSCYGLQSNGQRVV